MTILAIDTSFEDSAAAVVQETTILSNVLSTDFSIYEEFGGVVPRLAREYHHKHIDPTITFAMKKARIIWGQVDAIAVTQGPGLAITLEVGIAKAKELSQKHKKPLVAVNHMEGHLLSFLSTPKKRVKSKLTEYRSGFPAMAILISGGHTQFVYVNDIGVYEIVGETQDDAIGECLDKVGRMLGLGYPAGHLIEKLAKEGRAGVYPFPIPMRQVKNANTSFSGLKTAAMRVIEAAKANKGGRLTKQDIADIAYAFQDACFTHLIEKMQVTLQERKVKSIILGGGVVANTEIRKRMRQVARHHNVPLYLPYSKKLCTDNAAMIGIAGYFKVQRKEFVGDIDTLDRVPTMRLG